MTEWFCKKCRRVFRSKLPKCCGEVVEFSPEKHGGELVSLSNSWISVWEKWGNHTLLEGVACELANNGSYGAATALNAFIEKLLDEREPAPPAGRNKVMSIGKAEQIAEKRAAAADLRVKAAAYLEQNQVARADLCELTAERLEKEASALEFPGGVWERLNKIVKGGG